MTHPGELSSGVDGRQGQCLDCIEIREAVYLRMASGEVREAVQKQVGEELESTIFERLFPTVRAEAVSRYKASNCRGIVLWRERSIQYVPEGRIGDALVGAGPDTAATVKATLNQYDPGREAIVALVLSGFERVVHLEDTDTTLGFLRKLIA